MRKSYKFSGMSCILLSCKAFQKAFSDLNILKNSAITHDPKRKFFRNPKTSPFPQINLLFCKSALPLKISKMEDRQERKPQSRTIFEFQYIPQRFVKCVVSHLLGISKSLRISRRNATVFAQQSFQIKFGSNSNGCQKKYQTGASANFIKLLPRPKSNKHR